MSKPPLRDRDGLQQQAGVAMDLALLAVQTEFFPAKRQASKDEKCYANTEKVFSEFCWDNGTKNSHGNIANQAWSACLSESEHVG
jgi:hypothetical protein